MRWRALRRHLARALGYAPAAYVVDDALTALWPALPDELRTHVAAEAQRRRNLELSRRRSCRASVVTSSGVLNGQ